MNKPEITPEMIHDVNVIMRAIDELLVAVHEVLRSEDNTGCSDDLTVVSKEAIEHLRRAAYAD